VNKKSMLDITNNSVKQASYFQQIAKTHLFLTWTVCICLGYICSRWEYAL